MMPRYIDAERMPSDKFWEDLTDKEKAKVLAYLLTSPTVDVEEVRHGEWIKQHVSQELCGVEYYHCSLCNHEEQYKPPYCPHCGARMDKKEKTNGNNDGFSKNC